MHLLISLLLPHAEHLVLHTSEFSLSIILEESVFHGSTDVQVSAIIAPTLS